MRVEFCGLLKFVDVERPSCIVSMRAQIAYFALCAQEDLDAAYLQRAQIAYFAHVV